MKKLSTFLILLLSAQSSFGAWEFVPGSSTLRFPNYRNCDLDLENPPSVYVQTSTYRLVNRYGVNPLPVSSNGYEGNECELWGDQYNLVDSCPANTRMDLNQMCRELTQSDILSQYNDNRTGCSSHGGKSYPVQHPVTLTSATDCVTEEEFISRIKSEKVGLIVGRVLNIGGILLTATGIVGMVRYGAASILSRGTSAKLISSGIHASVAGAFFGKYDNVRTSNDMSLSNYLSESNARINALKLDPHSGLQSSDPVSAGGKRIEINLANFNLESPDTPTGKVATVTDEATGRVEKTVYIPNHVLDQMSNPDSVDLPNEVVKDPLNAAGVSVSNYDYENNTVTTDTIDMHGKGWQNTDNMVWRKASNGSTFATPEKGSTAPSVSSDADGAVVGAPTSDYVDPLESTGTAPAGPNPLGDSGLLEQIKNNTGKSAEHLEGVKDSLSNTVENDNDALNDGSNLFDGFSNDLKDSLNDFVFVDPLGLNGASSGNIPSYGFDILGKHFVILDQSMIDKLPLDLMRSLFLFIAALLALLITFSGV